MSHPLQTRLADVRCRARWVLAVHGISCMTAAVIGAVVLVCLADWLFHFDDTGVRLILDAGLVTLAAWMTYRYLWWPLRLPLCDLDIALRIEERYPGFQDSLASTVEFLEQDADPRVGSPALQQAVIEQTLLQVEDLDFRGLVQTRGARRVSVIAVVVCLFTGLLVGFNLSESAIALERLAFPFSAPNWPRTTNLQLLDADMRPLEFDEQDPLRIARGSVFKLYVENRSGRLPAKVSLEHRFADGKTTIEPLRGTTLRDERGQPREVAAGQVPAVKGPLWLRAVGGDHADMEWLKLLVIPPPVVESLQVTLTAPAYTKRPVEKLPEGVGHVQGFVGTKVEIKAKVNKPLQSAALRLAEQDRQPAALAADRKQFTTEFVIHEAGLQSYWLDLRDAEGFENGDPPRYEIRGIADLVPEIIIESPASDLLVTADAEIPLRTVARDDLGVKEIRLQYKLGESEGSLAGSVTLFDGNAPRPLNDSQPAIPNRPREHAAEWLWKLGDLNLAHGSRVVFQTEATDDYDLGPEHVGRSISRTLSIVSREEKVRELAQRQANLLEDVERAFKLQTEAANQTGELNLQLQKAGNLRPQDVDMLQRVELSQRQLAARLTGSADGLQQRTDSLLAELRDNKLNDAETERRLEKMATELARVGDEHLPAIEQNLTQARKQAQGDSAKDARTLPKSRASESVAPTLPQALERVAENQTAVLESLEELKQQLAQWRNERDATQDVAEIAAGQEELNRQTAEIGKQTITKSRDQLSPQQQADLARLAERQKKQAEKFEQVEQKLRDMLGKQDQTNPSSAEALRDAIEHSRDAATAGRMREAADRLGENRIGDAAGAQQQALENLRDMEDILRNRRESDTETLVKKLKASEQELDTLRHEQQELLQKVRKANEIPDAAQRQAELEQLQKQQEQLRDTAAKAARRLQRLQASRPGDAARRAAQRMQQAEADLAEGDAVEAAAEQQEALDDLEQAQRELASERRQAEDQLAREQLDKIADELKSMISREQSALDETKRLDGLKTANNTFTRSQLKTLRDLADTQRGLQQETDRLAEKLTTAEVLSLALKGASRHMQRAVDRLTERDTGEQTQKAQAAARQRFVDLVDALKPEKTDPQQNANQPEEQQPGDGGGKNSGPPGEAFPALAQLKMLRTLQQELNDRTTELAALREKQGSLTPAEEQELATIAREQGALADLARNLTRESAEGNSDGKPSDQ